MKTASALFVVMLGAGWASAQPKADEPTERIHYGDKTKRPTAGSLDEGWVEISDATPASHGREYITVDASAGPLMRLKVTAARGRPVVQTVRVDLKDGTSRTTRIYRCVDKANPAVIDLRGPVEVVRVVVTSEGSAKNAYAVVGEQPRAVARR